MSTANRVIKNTGYLYAKMGITMFISLYTTRLILNSLGASDFGIFNIVGGAISMLGFLNGSMASATQRFMSYSEGEGNKEKQKNIFNVGIIIHAIIAFVMGIVLVGMGFVFFNGVLNIPEGREFASHVVYGSLVISTMLTVMNVPYDAAMNAHENMKYYAIVGIFESLLKLAVALACVHTSKDKLIVYGVLMACIPFVTLTIMKAYCHRHYEECIIAPRRYFSKPILKEMVGFAGWNFLGSMSSLVGIYGNGLVIYHFFGTVLNADIGIAGQLSGQLQVFSTNMMKALNPVIVKSAGARHERNMIRYAFVGCKFSFLLLAFFAIPFLIETPYILRIWLKNVPEWAILFARLQVTRTLMEMLCNGIGIALSAVGKIKEVNIINGFLNLVPLFVSWLLFSYGFQPYWIYIVAIFFMVICNKSVTIAYCIKYGGMRVRDYLKEVIFPSVLCFAFPFVLGCLPVFVMADSFIRLLLCLTITSIAFIVTCYLAGLNNKERSNIRSILPKYLRDGR